MSGMFFSQDTVYSHTTVSSDRRIF